MITIIIGEDKKDITITSEDKKRSLSSIKIKWLLNVLFAMSVYLNN